MERKNPNLLTSSLPDPERHRLETERPRRVAHAMADFLLRHQASLEEDTPETDKEATPPADDNHDSATK